MTINLLTTRSAGDTIVASTDNAEFQNIIDEVNAHTAAASPHANHLITTGDTMTGQLTIDQDATGTAALNIDGEETTANGITAAFDALTTGTGLSLTSNSADTGTRTVAQFTNDNTAATGATVLQLQQDAAQRALYIDQNGNADSIFIETSATTSQCLDIDANSMTTGIVVDVVANGLTTGSVASFSSDSADTGTRNLVSIVNDNTAATGARCLSLQQDSSDHTLLIDTNGNGTSIEIDSEASSARVLNIQSVSTGNVIDVATTGNGTNIMRIVGSHATFTGNGLRFNMIRAASSSYRFIECWSGNDTDREFAVDGAGQIHADSGTITTPADYVCHDCGHSTLEKHMTCPKCDSPNYHWNDDIKQFIEISKGTPGAISLAEKMGLMERKSPTSDRWNVNVNRMVGFLGFGVHQLLDRIEALEAKLATQS
jgi:hypothetical protein